jgi:predicted dehydrogenase
MPQPALGIAVVGLGRMGEVHCRNLSARVAGARLAGVADADAALARRAGERFGVRWSSDASDVVADRRVDAIVVATPPPTHPQLITLAVGSAKPVLCEKPLAYDERDARAAVEAAARAGVPLQLGFHRRFDRDHAAARAAIEAGELGAIQMLFSSMRDRRAPPEPALRRERLLFDATSHDLDAARWLAGEVIEVSAFGTRLSSSLYERLGEYDNVITVLRFASGALGVIDNSRATGYGFDCRTEIVGTKATLRIDAPRLTNVEWLTPGAARRDHTATFLDRFSAAYVAELEAFAEVVRDGRAPSVDGEDGLMAMRLSLAAERSLQLGTALALGDGARRQPGRRLEHAGPGDQQ